MKLEVVKFKNGGYGLRKRTMDFSVSPDLMGRFDIPYKYVFAKMDGDDVNFVDKFMLRKDEPVSLKEILKIKKQYEKEQEWENDEGEVIK